MLKGNLRKEFDQFPWVENNKHLSAWKKGMTGYPIVDAGMRELYETGWMHNRLRMVVASFLIKHFCIHDMSGICFSFCTDKVIDNGLGMFFFVVLEKCVSI